MVEEDLGPLAERVSSLVKVRSLVEAASPLNQLVILRTVSHLVLVRTKFSIIELLFPRLDILGCLWVEEAMV